MIRIIADSAIPFLEGVLEPYASVRYIPGAETGPEDVRDADALIVRTRTKCRPELLEGSSVKLIASATIGMDHIDEDYCRSRGITVRNAAGCNAGGVADYVFTALYAAAARAGRRLGGLTLGVIGVGHVGGIVADYARKLGFRVLLCDPPRAAAEGGEGFCSMDSLLSGSDIVTLHVPLNAETYGMAGKDFFGKMRPGAFFINASRGETVDENALCGAASGLGPIIIDTWCGEPEINPQLLEKALIATPHIAGYSYYGKQRATADAVRAAAAFFGIDGLRDFFPQGGSKELSPRYMDLSGKTQAEIAEVFQDNYPIFTDDFALRSSPGDFEKIRSEYAYRRELRLLSAGECRNPIG